MAAVYIAMKRGKFSSLLLFCYFDSVVLRSDVTTGEHERYGGGLYHFRLTANQYVYVLETIYLEAQILL